MTALNNALQSVGGYTVILVIFAGIALFLILRLRSVLGKRVGFEKPPLPPSNAPPFNGPILNARALPPEPGRQVPDPRSALGQQLMQIVNKDPHFDPPVFLSQAETAFRTIVTAFAAGDKPTLQSLLTPHVYETFVQAVDARTQAGAQLRVEIKAIRFAGIEEALVSGDVAVVVVRFESSQLTQQLDSTGAPLPGQEQLEELTDLWSFERQLNGQDLVWRLSAARSG